MHTPEKLNWINDELKAIGVKPYRFCVENDCYVCDEFGHFYSVCQRQYTNTGKPYSRYRINYLKGSIDKYGYRTYRIVVDGVKKHLKGHRMMMNAWIGMASELVVNHKDGNKQNNTLDNLEWCTVAENNAHAIETGLFDPHSIPQKYKIPKCEWTTIYVLNRHCGFSLSELGRMNHCTHDTIKRVVKRVESILPKEVVYGA